MAAIEPKPTERDLDAIYAQLVREQPDNEFLWERIVERAKAARKRGEERSR